MNARALRRGSFAVATAIALSLGSASGAHAAGVDPAKATPVQREQAQSRFLKGRDLYNAKSYDAALAELTASLDIVASPNTRLYVGRCLRDMGRTVAAYVELGRTAVEAKELLRDDNRYDKAAQAATDERAQLAAKLGFVDVRVVHAAPDTTLQVANGDVRRGGWEEPVPVLPGNADIVVQTPGRAPVRQRVQVAAGGRLSVEIDAAADAPVAAGGADAAQTTTTGPRFRPAAYATAGLAAVGLVTFIVAGSMANSTYADLETACGAGPCPPGRESDVSSGKTQQTIANVGLVVFAVSAAASVTLFVVGSPKKATTTGAAASARVTASPSFVGLQGAF